MTSTPKKSPHPLVEKVLGLIKVDSENQVIIDLIAEREIEYLLSMESSKLGFADAVIDLLNLAAVFDEKENSKEVAMILVTLIANYAEEFKEAIENRKAFLK